MEKRGKKGMFHKAIHTMKKSLILIGAIAAMLLLGAAGGALFDAYVAPRLASLPVFENKDFFKKLSERVTIINKTEQVIIREDDTVEKIVSQPATAVVGIVFSSDADTETRTGVLLTNDGLIATYGEQAPIDLKRRYPVILFDGSHSEAEIIGYDTLTNLIFFRLDGRASTPAIALSNSDDARAGKRLIALGSTAAAYQNRLAVSVLGGRDHTFNLSGKTVSSSEKWEGVFEIDLVSPERFVGGPAIGFNGEMVGIVGTLTIDNVTRTFLIPANAVRESLDRVIAGTLGMRAYFGAYYLPITKALAVNDGLSRDQGALVYAPSGKTGLAVIADSPAAKAGFLVNDIIVSVNGRNIDFENPLPKILGRLNGGEQVEFMILRDGEERMIRVTL